LRREMTKREVVKQVLEGQRPPYVPWSFGFTQEAKAKLQQHLGQADLEPVLQNHLLKLGSDIGFFADLGGNRVQDVFGVVWDRSVDKDIGIVKGCVLPCHSKLKGGQFKAEKWTGPDTLRQTTGRELWDKFTSDSRASKSGFSFGLTPRAT
jgi:uroporphyrinogen decarboxylase